VSAPRPRVSLFFPVYKDEGTVARVAEKALAVLGEQAEDYEVSIVDDASPDRAGAIADEIAAREPHVRVIHHPSNLGYGKALRSGFEAARHEWICFTDGDDEYEVDDLRKLLRLRDRYADRRSSWNRSRSAALRPGRSGFALRPSARPGLQCHRRVT